jgi:hypothetical protein
VAVGWLTGGICLRPTWGVLSTYGSRQTEKVAMDRSGANTAAIDVINVGRGVPIVARQVK